MPKISITINGGNQLRKLRRNFQKIVVSNTNNPGKKRKRETSPAMDSSYKSESSGQSTHARFSTEDSQNYLSRAKETEERAEKYRTALLTPYRKRDEKDYAEKLTKLFQEKLPSFLGAIFASTWREKAGKEYKLCLHKFFLEFARTRKFANWEEDGKQTLEWLVNDRQNSQIIEEALQEKQQLKVLHFLIMENNHAAVEWMFKFKNYNTQQLREIFDYEDGKIFDLLATTGDGDDKQVGIINLVFSKFRKLLSEEKVAGRKLEKKVNAQKEQLRLQLQESFEWETEMWTELEGRLVT